MSSTKLLPATPLFEEIRNQYLKILSPIFFPTNPFKHDIIRYFSSLLRVGGLEGKGWDPYLESRSLLENFNVLMQIPLPEDRFENDLVVWRLGLIFYNHIVEMSAPYEVIGNLLRFGLEEGYSTDPFYKYLTPDKRKRYKKSGLFPYQKIEILSSLGDRVGLDVAGIFNNVVDFDVRNAIAHSDFIIADDGLHCRKPLSAGSFTVPFEEVDRLITGAKAFISAFFILEAEARRVWGQHAGRAVPYDRRYKGLMEVLSDPSGMLNGFKVHWPKQEDSFYRRTEDGSDMVNCFLDLTDETIELFVGCYARRPGAFSPLVEEGAEARYSPLDGSDIRPEWDEVAAVAAQNPLPEVNIQVSEADSVSDIVSDQPMLTITPLSPHAIEIVAEGHFTAADVGPALDRMTAILDGTPKLDILADVRGSPSIALSAITEELKRLPLVFRMIRQIERVAIVADAPWVRLASKIEGAVIPGVHYEVYERHEAAHAREWLLRHTDEPRAG